MYSGLILYLLGLFILEGDGGEPILPQEGSLPFFAYYKSYYRGMCSGTVISPIAVLSAAVCVASPSSDHHDKRPLTLVFGSIYRHMRRGVRVSVQKVLIPKMPSSVSEVGYLLQRAPSVLILHKKVPDSFLHTPLRSLPLETSPDFHPPLHEECIMPGFHFFHKGQLVYPGPKFLLQKHVRVQFLNVVKMHIWCGTLAMKFQTLMMNLGHQAVYYEASSAICVKDPTRHAQPCHGMYGSPLICNGRVIGILSAPDAQWTNCTGLSNIIHLLRGDYIQSFMNCIQKELVDNEFHADWKSVKSLLYSNEQIEDDMDHLYDKVDHHFGETSESSE